jgi:hypothetical protein
MEEDLGKPGPHSVRPRPDAAANAAIDEQIRATAKATSFGEHLAELGQPHVALNDEGDLVEYRPDGTTTVLDPTHI